MISWGFDLSYDDPPWGQGLQTPDPRFPVGTEVAITQTITGPSTTGEHELVVQEEVGRVSRAGSRRILVRMERRRRAVSVYLPPEAIEALPAPDPSKETP